MLININADTSKEFYVNVQTQIQRGCDLSSVVALSQTKKKLQRTLFLKRSIERIRQINNNKHYNEIFDYEQYT